MLTRTEIAPFEPADGYIKSIRYRSASSKAFQELKPPFSSVYVPCDDIRSIPRHELEIELEQSALPKPYQNELKRLALVILCRDPLLKREWVLARAPVDALPTSFVLDDKKLRETGSPKEVAFDVSVCAASTIRSDDWPRRRASRLTLWRVAVANHKKGPRFPWVRKTPDEFKAAGLPANSMSYVNLLDAPEALLTDPNLKIEDALEVWVHEDAWILLQQSEASNVAAVQRLFVAQVTSQILSLAAKPLHDGQGPIRDSLIQQLVDYIATRAGAKKDDLNRKLEISPANLDPYVSAAYGVNAALRSALD